jgi:hypothetical protein
VVQDAHTSAGAGPSFDLFLDFEAFKSIKASFQTSQKTKKQKNKKKIGKNRKIIFLKESPPPAPPTPQPSPTLAQKLRHTLSHLPAALVMAIFTWLVSL